MRPVYILIETQVLPHRLIEKRDIQLKEIKCNKFTFTYALYTEFTTQ